MFRRYRRRFWVPFPIPSKSTKTKTIPNKLQLIKLLSSLALPLAVGIFTLVTTVQNRRIARQEREQDVEQSEDEQREAVFMNYINDIARYRDRNIDNLTNNTDKLLYIRTKTLTSLRKLDIERKKRILLFLKESSLLSEHNLLTGADFSQIQISGDDCQFTNATFFGVDFQQVSFISCLFANVTFSHSNFHRARFTRSIFSLSHFVDCHLNDVDFQNVIMVYSDFNSSKLSHADFRRAKLDHVNFSDVDLTGAIFTNYSQLEHLSIRNSLLPNGTFSQIDEIQFDSGSECLLLDKWYALPETIVLGENCTFTANISNATVSLISDVRVRSMLIDAGQAEIMFKVRQSHKTAPILITIMFASINGVYELHNIGMFNSIFVDRLH
jgi:uncharacterized protein YjbI with pentapeptide repeats